MLFYLFLSEKIRTKMKEPAADALTSPSSGLASSPVNKSSSGCRVSAGANACHGIIQYCGINVEHRSGGSDSTECRRPRPWHRVLGNTLVTGNDLDFFFKGWEQKSDQLNFPRCQIQIKYVFSLLTVFSSCVIHTEKWRCHLEPKWFFRVMP